MSSNSHPSVPDDTLVAGLRQRRDELAEQLARLNRTRQNVESGLDVLEQALRVVGGQRNRSLPSVATLQAAPNLSLSAAVRRALATAPGPLTTAEIRGRLTLNVTPGQISTALAGMAHTGMASGTPTTTTAKSGVRHRCGYSWSLTDKGRAVAAKEGGAA